MDSTQDKRQHDVGDKVTIGGEEMEVTAVTYQEDPETHERKNFQYTFQSAEEVEAGREAERKHQEEQEALKAQQAKDAEAARDDVPSPVDAPAREEQVNKNNDEKEV